MIARAHVGDNGHLAAIESQALAQQAASSCFKNSCIDIGVHQDIAGAAGAAAIAIVNLTTIDVHTIGVGHANSQMVCLEKVSGEADSGGFAIGAGHGNDGNSAVVAIGKHVVYDCFANIAAFAKGRADVHSQARCCIDFDNATVLLFKRF